MQRFVRPINFLREFSIPLIAGVVCAMVWSNLSPAGYAGFVTTPLLSGATLHFISNELFMVFFFGVAAVEITQSFMSGGDLNPIRRAINPLFATVGGVVGPVVVFFALNVMFGSGQLGRGWGIPTATDIALAWLAARLAFGERHPAVSYLLVLAVVDDAIGLAIIAVFYPNPELPVSPGWLILVLTGMAVSWLLRSARVATYWPYVLIGGVLSWSGLHNAHLHPALALVFIIPFLPHTTGKPGRIFEYDYREVSTLARFEHEWKVVVDFGLFIFGLANAGVPFSGTGAVTWIILASLILGKGGGIFFFGWLGERLGFPLPEGVHNRDLILLGIIAGTGFTVALFVAGEAFVDPVICDAAKMGAMISIAAAVLGVILARVLKVQRRQ